MSWSMPGQKAYVYLRASDFIRWIPGCPREGLSVSVEPIELQRVGVLVEESKVRTARLDEFLH